MRNFWKNSAYILLILQFVLLASAAVLGKTLTLTEQGDVIAETDRYLARFNNGVLVHFHNKLTRETYVTLPKEHLTRTGILIQPNTGEVGIWDVTSEAWGRAPKRLEPLAVEITYHSDWRTNKTVYLRIAIDSRTQDLLIHQSGISESGGVTDIMWGGGYLNGQQVDLILPANGGQIIDDSTEFNYRSFRYPGAWETQLAIFQGEQGGFFVSSTDTTFRFKEVRYHRNAEHFSISFLTTNFAPFHDKNEITSVIWRLNSYRGDWQVPARLYRDWMKTTFQRKQPPAWAKNIELVIPTRGLETNYLPLLAQHVNPSRTLFYLRGWRLDGVDENYPDYTPNPEFGDFLETAHRYGFRVMLNVNFVGVSYYHPRYPEFEKYQYRHKITGHKFEWNPTDDPTFREEQIHAFINPASNAFRKLLVAQLKQVVETYPIEALHLDINSVIENDANGLIDGLTAAEGNVLLHQEFAEAMPEIVFGGEGLNELTTPYVSFAQRWNIPEGERPHPISSFLFSPDILLHGYFPPNPDLYPEGHHELQEAYHAWDVLPTVWISHLWHLYPNMTQTRKLLKSVGTGESWNIYPVGDVNKDGVVNVLDMIIVANGFGTAEAKYDMNGDSVVNILDLILIAQNMTPKF